MKKFRKRKKLIIVLVILVVVIVGLTIFVKQKVSQSTEETNTIQLEEAQKRDLSDFISLTGTVSGESSMSYSSSATAEILSIDVAVGDEVKEGDVIATLDQKAIQSQIDTLEKSLSNAEALSKNQEKVNQHTLDQAKADQKTQLEAANQSISDAQEDYTSAQQTCQNLKNQLNDLKNKMNAANDESEKAEYQNQITELQTQVSEAESAQKSAEKAVTEAKNNYNSVKTTTDEAIYTAQNAVDTQKYSAEDNTTTKTQLDELYAQLEDCTIRSQTSGIVTEVNANVGDTNTPNATLVKVESEDMLIMTASVDEKDILKLQEGMKAVVTSDALDDVEINGEIVKVVKVNSGSSTPSTDSSSAGSSTASGGFSIQIKLEDCDLLSGMSAKAKITLKDKSNILCVPYDLVLEDEEGNSYILCAEDNGDGTYTAVRKNIKTGEEINYYTEITGGDLNEGDYIIMDYSVQEGDIFEGEVYDRDSTESEQTGAVG